MKDPAELYIDLVEKVLINSIYRDGSIAPWTTGKYDHAKRMTGRDWPAQALTMIGGMRLRHLRQCCVEVLRDGIAGDFIECGVWRGGAAILMRAVLECVDEPERRVFLADSFRGLPPPSPDFPADANDTHYTVRALACAREEVARNFAAFGLLDERVVFLEGWFKSTLPGPVEKLALLRIDADMYGSTWEALDALYPRLSEGGICIIDDYGSVEGCRRAVDDYCARQSLGVKIKGIDGAGVWWRKEPAFAHA